MNVALLVGLVVIGTVGLLIGWAIVAAGGRDDEWSAEARGLCNCGQGQAPHFVWCNVMQ